MDDNVRLIDANALHKEVTSFDHSVIYKDWVQSAIASAPTISDVAPVVRCKGCKFCDDAYCNDGRKLKDLYYCNWFGSVVEKNDFCSYGAKMDLEEQTV